ncbi:MAG: hypothetical protein Q9194_005629 [Teloschistes cf. exilis]
MLPPIVFVHGLTGHRDDTWKAHDAEEPWPKAFLPQDIPNARLLTYGYDADVAHWMKPAGQNTTRENAQNLVNDLCTYRLRTKSPKRPILFIAHSLGGLIVQDALLLCINPSEEFQTSILESTRGVCFLGTPNAGSDFTKFATAVANIISLSVVKKPNTQVLEVLKARSQVLAHIKNGFHTLVRRRVNEGSHPIRLHAFIEELPVALTGHRVVTAESAIIPGYNSSTLPYNHMNMTKFSREDDVGYGRVSGKLMEWVMEIEGTSESLELVILPKSATQESHHQEAMNDPRLGGRTYYSYPKRSVRVIDRPDIIGRLTSLLKQDAASTRVVILHGMGGQGKTVLAASFCRQAESKNLFLAIFWLDASSRDASLKGLITISNLVKRRDDQVFDTLEERIEFTRERMEEWNRPWLLVMDNYDDPSRFPDLPDYIPSSKFGSVLITTRQANLERLGTVVTVPPMSKKESLLLLYDRCGCANNPGSEDHYAVEIVETLGYLPLAIDQAGAYIRNRVHLPFSRFVGEYNERKDDIWSRVPVVWEYKRPVYNTWEMSFELIDNDKNKRDGKGKILTMLAFLDFRSISEEIFLIPRSSRYPETLGITEDPSWLRLLLRPDGEWDLLKLENLLTDFKDLSLVQLNKSFPGTLLLSLHPLVSEWVKYRAAPDTKRQCLYQAIRIVEVCLRSKRQNAAKRLVSVDFEQQVHQHRKSCLDNLRELRKNEDLKLDPREFVEHSMSFEATLEQTQSINRSFEMLEQATEESSIELRSMLIDGQLQQQQAILDWLSMDDRYIKPSDLITRTSAGSGQWFIQGAIFQDWLSNANADKVLWVVGYPGVGKTVIASQVIYYLTETYANSMCLSFFCDFRKEYSPLQALSSLLRQASSRLEPIPHQVRQCFAKHVQLETALDYAEVAGLLRLTIGKYISLEDNDPNLGKRVFIVVDALDELGGRHSTMSVVKTLRDLIQEFIPSINMLLTSRDSVDLRDEVADVMIYRLEAQSREIELYVSERLSSDRLAAITGPDSQFRSRISRIVVEKADGMFLFARLIMQEIEAKRTRKAIESFIKEVPPTLADLYHRKMLRIDSQNDSSRYLGIGVLMWLSVSSTSLGLRVLQHAIFSMETDDHSDVLDEKFLISPEDLPALCCGLAVIDKDAHLVSLAHYTVQEYLRHRADIWFPMASNTVTRSCIRYLSLPVFTDGPCATTEIRDRLQEYPFAEYAAMSWLIHANENRKALTDAVNSEIVSFLLNEKRFASWRQLLGYCGEAAKTALRYLEVTGKETFTAALQAETPVEIAKLLGLSPKILDQIALEQD